MGAVVMMSLPLPEESVQPTTAAGRGPRCGAPRCVRAPSRQHALPGYAQAPQGALRRRAVPRRLRRRLRVAPQPGAKALGTRHVVFHKKSGLQAKDMTPSSWLYDQLRRFRAGIEAGISYLELCFGLANCRWRGLPRFKAYMHSAIFAHNLVRLARRRLRPT